jgi:diamine N-acetyltransferase
MKVRLRAIEPEDLDLLYSIENDRDLWEVGTTNVPYSRYTLHDYVATSSDDIYADRQVRMMIDNEAGETVGIADLMRFDPQHLRAEVGMVIMKPYRGKGYGAATIEALVDYAVRILHLHQLYVVIAANHHATVRLFAEHDFTHQTLLKDWLQEGHDFVDAVVMQRFL